MQRLPIVAMTSLLALAAGCASARPLTFPTPEAAVQALVDASADQQLADRLLGAGGFALLQSGDEVADQEDLEVVRAMIQKKVAFADAGTGCKIALLGDDAWELPIPLVEEGSGWCFDVEAGRDEILSRRVGRNELSTIATLRALVEAQREYAAVGRDDKPPAFAGRLWSTEGRHDGLYWATAEGEPQSPMGPLVAEAADEGYVRGESRPAPYHGYCYRMLVAQGPNAAGGARSYLDASGLLTGGFAVLAWPATYGNSGVMTFLVNQQGIVFQRDLGADTARQAAAIQAYDPDLKWVPVRE